MRKSAMLLLAMFGLTAIALAQTQTVTGTVTDKKGEPIPGVTVSIKGSKTATSTNAQGVYTLTNVPSDAVLVFTGVGVTSREENVSGKSSLNVDVETSVSNLNEVIVVGYGTARKRDLTGSVASVKAKDFNKGLVTGADQLIQGKVAGVQIINTSGAPGGATTVRIRGNSSVRSGNQPLFVIDGIPLDGRSARPGVDINLTDAPGRTPDANPLNFINPNDIASMDVLKDASATAIYGSRGANGVVLITTKKGLSGASKIDFSASAGISNLFRNYKVLDASQYRAALKEYGLTSGDFGGNVDAMDEITRTAISQNYNIAIGGGNESGKYRLSAGYQNLEGIIKKSGFKKYTANLNTNFKFLESKKLGLDINVLTSQTTENIAPIANTSGFTGSLISQAISWNPTHPLRNPDGTIWIKDAAIGQTTINPLTTLEAYSDVSNLTGVLASISPYYKFNNDLEYRFLYSVNHSVGTRRTSLKSYINIQSIEGRGWANYGNNELTTQLAQHTLNYNKKISSSLNLNAVVGYEYQKFDSKGTGQSGQGFLTTDVDYTNYLQGSSQDSRRSTSFADPISELQSFFGRVAFNLQDKYLLTATMRGDGSSKFGENNKYGYFPSVAGAWNISNEDFMKDGLFDNFKLRVGWGKTGNQEFPAGSAQERYSFSQGSYQQSNVANPDLKWETSTTTNAGIDFSLFKGRLSGTVDYFNKQTSDLLFNFDAIQPAPATKYWVNLGGDVINKGWEVALNALIVKSRDFNWNFGVNAAFLQNELQNYVGPAVLTGELSGQGISGTRVQKLENGYPLNSFYVRRFLGLDKSSGTSTYTDNGNSFFYIGNPNPSTLLGISTDVTYKKLSLSVNMNGAFGHEIYNNTLNSVLNIGNLGSGRNIAASLLEGDIQESVGNGLAASSRYLENGNYLKIANATLSYGIGNIGRSIKNLNIFITGQNLAVFTKFTGFDPEVNTDKQIDGVPSFGIEYIPYPSPRTFLLGVNFSL